MTPAALKPNVRGFTSVMATRKPTPPDDLEYFPTPPWATRALFPIIQELSPEPQHHMHSAREPASGEGHMAEVLEELFPRVWASDVYAHGYGYGAYEDYLDQSTGLLPCDWVITNPPFSAAEAFIRRGLAEASVGVAMLLRLQFVEASSRYSNLFRHRPPSIIAVFVDRCAMTKGEWRPKARSATAYAWFVWSILKPARQTEFRWIPPGTKKRLTHPSDARRFARIASAPLLESPHG